MRLRDHPRLLPASFLSVKGSGTLVLVQDVPGPIWHQPELVLWLPHPLECKCRVSGRGWAMRIPQAGRAHRTLEGAGSLSAVLHRPEPDTQPHALLPRPGGAPGGSTPGRRAIFLRRQDTLHLEPSGASGDAGPVSQGVGRRGLAGPGSRCAPGMQASSSSGRVEEGWGAWGCRP